jgi:hypothetical protein
MAITYHVEVGDYIRVWAHGAQPRYRDMWWKVTAKEGETLELVNRHGERGGWSGHRTKFNRWQPGEPRNDGDLEYD